MIPNASIPHSPEKRRYARVDCNRSVRIVGRQKALGLYTVTNLSLGGIFIQGDIDIPIGEECCLEMRQTSERASVLLAFSGKIIRREHNGVGVAFVTMDRDCFMFLQTMVLYSADDPNKIAENFSEDFAPGFSPSC